MINENIKNLIVSKNKGKKLKKPSKWLFPFNIEKKYSRILKKFVFQISKAVREILIPAIPQILQEVEATYPNNDNRNDDFLDSLTSIFLSIEKIIEPFMKKTIEESEKIAQEISSFNMNQFQKVNNSVFGIDIFVDEPYLRDQIELFSRQNAQLIESIPEQDLLQIAGIVERGLLEGKRFQDISQQIQKRVGITTRRANTIARDQTAKLNASLTRLRQENLGIETYRWQTSGDERVRDSHKIMDGKICSWEDPTVYLNEKTGKWVKRPKTATQNQVGEDINCRCTALGIVEGFE